MGNAVKVFQVVLCSKKVIIVYCNYMCYIMIEIII